MVSTGLPSLSHILIRLLPRSQTSSNSFSGYTDTPENKIGLLLPIERITDIWYHVILHFYTVTKGLMMRSQKMPQKYFPTGKAI